MTHRHPIKQTYNASLFVFDFMVQNQKEKCVVFAILAISIVLVISAVISYFNDSVPIESRRFGKTIKKKVILLIMLIIFLFVHFALYVLRFPELIGANPSIIIKMHEKERTRLIIDEAHLFMSIELCLKLIEERKH